MDETQLYDWIYMSVFTSLYIGWLTVKVDSKFAPWFYRLMKMTPPVSKEQEIVNRLKEWRDNIRKPYNLEENPRQIDESSNIDLYLITKIDKILDEEK
ncbi:hypothetical protein [Nitrosopumilus sp.]|uniref:hypothetical protein n=1 Tax=Nitrosopumilus sp. TaxID=2024843 RepID=UPI003D123DE7